MWKKFSKEIKNGELVKGDKTAPPTRWWNILWLLFFGWKKQAVLNNVMLGRACRVGYRDFHGKTMLNSEFTYERRFRVRIGHEDCTFFGIDADGKETVLVADEGLYDKDDPRIQNLPLV